MRFYSLTQFIFSLIMPLITVCKAYTQTKLPNQYLTPPIVKIDGKLNEWKDGKLIYVKNMNIFYMMTNDDENLYLIIKSKNSTNNLKINGGGISFIVSRPNNKNACIVTFPVVDKEQLKKQMISQKVQNEKSGKKDVAVNPLAAASLKKQAVAAMKEIKVSGFKEIQDTLISIYNDNRIRAAIDYDDEDLGYEMSIPLKLLGLSTAKESSFFFKIAINPIQTGLFAGNEGFAGGPLAGTPGFSNSGFANGSSGGKSVRDLMFMRSTISFKGSYLVKKK